MSGLEASKNRLDELNVLLFDSDVRLDAPTPSRRQKLRKHRIKRGVQKYIERSLCRTLLQEEAFFKRRLSFAFHFSDADTLRDEDDSTALSLLHDDIPLIGGNSISLYLTRLYSYFSIVFYFLFH